LFRRTFSRASGPVKTLDQVWKSEDLSKRYLEGVRGAIPFADAQIDLMLRLARHGVPRVRSFLDLGCGDGVLGRAFLGQYPEARGVFLDFSESMIRAAQEKTVAPGPSTRFVVCDYGKVGWIESVQADAPFDLIVSGFSIHHQPDDGKRRIYSEIFELLSPGGMFLNLEHVASASSFGGKLFDDYFVEALCRFHRRQGTSKSDQQIADEYYHRPDQAANILAPVEAQCAWLHDIGFSHVDCFFKVFELALFGGIKPLSASAS